MKKMICVLLSIILGMGMMGCDSSSGSVFANKRTKFNVKYSADGIESFADIVCRNVNGDAKVTDVHTGDPYWTVIDIKLPGKVYENGQLCI